MTSKGTQFKWSDNDAIKMNPFKLNEPQDSISLTLVDTQGISHTFDRPNTVIDWASKDEVSRANHWHNQV